MSGAIASPDAVDVTELDEEAPLAPQSPEQKKGAEIAAKSAKKLSEKQQSLKLTNLHTGLTAAEAEAQLETWGYNEVVPNDDPEWVKIASRYLGLIPLMMLTVSILSASVVTTCESGTEDLTSCACTEARDWISFGLLFFELNLIVWADYFGEASSGNAIKELQRLSAPTANVMRDGEWKKLPKREIVPGDIIGLVIGACIPCDGVLRGEGQCAPLKIDAASVTGEPLPETKRVGDTCLAGTTVMSGELEMQAVETGEHSTMGETMKLINEVGQKGGKLKTMLGDIAKGVTLIAGVFCIALFLVLVVRDGQEVAQAVKQAFVILVAVLPVAMPVVITTGLAVGALELSEEKAIVQRLSAIEEMAGMDILCSDKTGTLTYGKMAIAKQDCVPFGSFTLDDLLLMSLLSSRRVNTDAIDTAVCNVYCKNEIGTAAERTADPKIMKEKLEPYEEKMFDPFSPLTKRVTATVRVKATGETWLVAKGAPEIMNALPGIDADTEAKASQVVDEKSAIGYKTLGVCRAKVEGDGMEIDGSEEWEMVGYLCIEDPARHDSAQTIVEAQQRGVEVKMITGDQKLIAKKVAADLRLGKAIFGPEIWLANNNAAEQAGGYGKLAEIANGFASVKPKHKHRVVEELQNLGHTVGMTGDGVNDAPALKKANVGIAVADATDAARGAADIVLTKEGLSTIVTAINRSRMIFRRLESYIIYRLASSCLILGFFFLGITALKFDFPTWTLILLSIINDLTVMATSKDNVRTSNYPLYWDIPRLCMLATVIGGVCIIQSFLLLYFLQQGSYNSSSSNIEWLSEIGLGDLEQCEIVSVMYLNLALSIQFNIFSSRNKKFVWQTAEEDDASPPPSIILLMPVIGACILSTVIAAEWDDSISLGGGNPMKGCGWGPCGAVWIWCIVWFFIVEVAKVFANGIWDSSDNGSVNDLFMSPLSRFLFTNKGKNEEEAEERDDNKLTDSANLAMQMKKVVSEGTGRRGSGNKNTLAGLVSASFDENDDKTNTAAVLLMSEEQSKVPTTLAKMANLTSDAKTSDLVAVINAMKQHIVQLEQRVAQLDGITVHQRPAIEDSKKGKK